MIFKGRAHTSCAACKITSGRKNILKDKLEQALRLRELGFRLSRRQLRLRFSRGLAGLIIRKIKTARGIPLRKLRRKLSGSLVLKVWREQGEAILASVDPTAVFRRYLKTNLGR